MQYSAKLSNVITYKISYPQDWTATFGYMLKLLVTVIRFQTNLLQFWLIIRFQCSKRPYDRFWSHNKFVRVVIYILLKFAFGSRIWRHTKRLVFVIRIKDSKMENPIIVSACAVRSRSKHWNIIGIPVNARVPVLVHGFAGLKKKIQKKPHPYVCVRHTYVRAYYHKKYYYQ